MADPLRQKDQKTAERFILEGERCPDIALPKEVTQDI